MKRIDRGANIRNTKRKRRVGAKSGKGNIIMPWVADGVLMYWWVPMYWLVSMYWWVPMS